MVRAKRDHLNRVLSNPWNTVSAQSMGMAIIAIPNETNSLGKLENSSETLTLPAVSWFWCLEGQGFDN